MKKQFITIEEGKRNALAYGMRYKTKTNPLNMAIGFICVVYGGATILLPTGSIFAIVGGLGMMANPIPINILIKNVYKDIKFKVGCLW